jgi:hypothetical protein
LRAKVGRGQPVFQELWDEHKRERDARGDGWTDEPKPRAGVDASALRQLGLPRRRPRQGVAGADPRDDARRKAPPAPRSSRWKRCMPPAGAARGRFTPSAHQHVLRLLSRLPVALAPLRVSPLEFWNWSQSLELTLRRGLPEGGQWT